MLEKKCFKCNTLKPLSEFYKHSQMQDGHLNKCKSCTKDDVGRHRKENIDSIRTYDRNRPNKSERNKKAQAATQEYRKKSPNKYAAHILVNNHIRDGKLVKKCCEVCGGNNFVVAHHDDYLKPLDVRWLCEVHHKAWHKANGEGLNG